MSLSGGHAPSLRTVVGIAGTQVSVDPVDTIIDSLVMGAGVTGVEWQVANGDVSQTLACRLQMRLAAAAAWTEVAFADDLSSIGPDVSKVALWRVIAYELRLIGVASGAGLVARVWRTSVYGVQP